MDVMDETRVKLAEMIGEGEFYVGASPGDGSDPKYRGPVAASDAVENVLAWARAAFAGTEATVATSEDGEDFPVVATITSTGAGEAPTVSGSRRKAKAEAKPATAEAKPVKAPASAAPKKATRKPSTK